MVELPDAYDEVSTNPEPVVIPFALRLRAFAVVIESAVKLKAFVVAARLVKACRPVPELKFSAVAPVALPKVKVLALDLVPILIAPVVPESMSRVLPAGVVRSRPEVFDTIPGAAFVASLMPAPLAEESNDVPDRLSSVPAVEVLLIILASPAVPVVANPFTPLTPAARRALDEAVGDRIALSYIGPAPPYSFAEANLDEENPAWA